MSHDEYVVETHPLYRSFHQVRHWYLVDIWDRINLTWMTVPRNVYLQVKHHYDKDETYLYDRVNDCPMKVSWHDYCKVRCQAGLLILGQRAASLVSRVRKIWAGPGRRRRRSRRRRGRRGVRKEKTKTRTKT